MVTNTFVPATIRLLLAVASFSIAADTASAQTTDEDPANVITVVAPRAVTNQVRRSVSGGGLATVTITIRVLYGDLNLTKPSDSGRLINRIRSAARDACRHLDRLYPLVVDRSCIDNAVAGALPRANAVIAAAGK